MALSATSLESSWATDAPSEAGIIQLTAEEDAAASALEDKRIRLGVQIREIAGYTESTDDISKLKDTGYFSITKRQNEPFVLWWKGEVPTAILDLVEIARRDFPVEVKQSPISRVEFRRAASRLMPYENMPAPSTALRDANFGITRLSAAEGGAGFNLQFAGVDSKRAVPSEATVTRIVQEVTGLRALQVSRGTPVVMTRNNAASPWSAGMFIESSSANCTSAFGVTRGGDDYLLTAAHCISNDRKDWWNGPAGSEELVACDNALNPSIVDRSRDAAMLLVDGSGACDRGSVDDIYYGGAWNLTTNDLRTLTNTGEPNFPGDLIRASGSTTGELLLEVKLDDEDWSCGGRFATVTCHHGITATRRDGSPSTIAVAEGDSGGPVVRKKTLANGESVMVPRGIISAGRGTTSCNQEGSKDEVRGDDATNDTCSPTLVYTPINPILTNFGATLK